MRIIDDGSDIALEVATGWLRRRLAARGARDRSTERLVEAFDAGRVHVIGQPRGSWLNAPLSYRGALTGWPRDDPW